MEPTEILDRILSELKDGKKAIEENALLRKRIKKMSDMLEGKKQNKQIEPKKSKELWTFFELCKELDVSYENLLLYMKESGYLRQNGSACKKGVDRGHFLKNEAGLGNNKITKKGRDLFISKKDAIQVWLNMYAS